MTAPVDAALLVQVRRLHAQGLRRSGIARELGISVGSAEGLIRRHIKQEYAKKRRPKAVPVAVVEAPALVAEAPAPIVALPPISRPLPPASTCQWPVVEGSPLRPWRMCGAPSVAGCSWCREHRGVVFVKRAAVSAWVPA